MEFKIGLDRIGVPSPENPLPPEDDFEETKKGVEREHPDAEVISLEQGRSSSGELSIDQQQHRETLRKISRETLAGLFKDLLMIQSGESGGYRGILEKSVGVLQQIEDLLADDSIATEEIKVDLGEGLQSLKGRLATDSYQLEHSELNLPVETQAALGQALEKIGKIEARLSELLQRVAA